MPVHGSAAARRRGRGDGQNKGLTLSETSGARGKARRHRQAAAAARGPPKGAARFDASLNVVSGAASWSERRDDDRGSRGGKDEATSTWRGDGAAGGRRREGTIVGHTSWSKSRQISWYLTSQPLGLKRSVTVSNKIRLSIRYVVRVHRYVIQGMV